MSQNLQEWCDNNSSQKNGIDTSLIMVSIPHSCRFPQSDIFGQAQAESLDTAKFDHTLSDPRTQAFLKRLLSLDHKTFLTQEAWKLDQQDIARITHILVRLQILDKFVDALSFPRNPSLRVMAKLPFPHRFPDNLERVCPVLCYLCLLLKQTMQIFTHLKDWSRPIEGLRRAFATLQSGSKKSKGKAITDFSSPDDEIQLPDHPTQDAIMAHNDIMTLLRAFRHAVSSQLHTILSHTELLTSAVSWFAQVCSILSLQENLTHT
jgi:hypothetical protein